MADVASTLRSWSTTPGNNAPSGGTALGSGLDDNLRELQAVTRRYLASKGSDMASAATVDLSTADGYFVDITGTTTITAFGTEAAGISYLLRFTGALTLTHNGTSLILPGAANITTANGDMAYMISLGSGNWKCALYQKADGTAVVATSVSAAAQSDQETATSTTTYVSPGRQHFHPSAAKAWGKVTGTTVDASYPAAGVSVNNSSTGVYVVTHGRTMSSSNYAVLITLSGTSNVNRFFRVGSRDTTTFTLNVYDVATDPNTVPGFEYVIFGDI